MPKPRKINIDIGSPGEQLKALLKEIYPLDLDNRVSFISRLDDALIAENQFTEIVYESSINYIVRRLITISEYLKRKYNPNDYPDGKYENEIRKFLREYTHIPSSEIERIFILLLDCLKVRNKKLSDKTFKTIIKKTGNNPRCYICGCSLNLTQKELGDSLEVEHVWPKAMGGSSDSYNLKLSCRRCNKVKDRYIDSNDFHYEEIALVGDLSDKNFLSELRWDYRVALWLHSNCSCVVCGKQASSEGTLKLARKDLSDSWHFLNIQAYCDKHAPE